MLREVVAEVLALLRPNVDKRVTLALSMDGELCVSLEPDLLKQVVLNLVLNGVEAMPDGGTLAISQRCVARDGGTFAMLTVHDTGVGIPADNLPRLFEPFFTTKPGGGARPRALPVPGHRVQRRGPDRGREQAGQHFLHRRSPRAGRRLHNWVTAGPLRERRGDARRGSLSPGHGRSTPNSLPG